MSPRRLLLAVCLLLLASFTWAQLLSNPGFESGADGWIITEKIPVSSTTTEAAYDGKLGLRLKDESTESGANIAAGRFDVTSGQKIVLGFMARSPDGAIASVSILPYNSNNQPLLDEKGRPPANVIIKKSSDWVHYAVEYVVPEEVSTFTISIRSWSTPTGIVDLDNFELKVE